MKTFKFQSAMEYLMTYGWAILIIAVVLGALFGLGFFNSANLAPKVGPGSCQVYRPNGPGTTTFINTEGTCNNELPQYVAQFNGGSSYISTGTAGLPTDNSPRSVFAWIYYSGYVPATIYSYGTDTNDNMVDFSIQLSSKILYVSGDYNDFSSTLAPPSNTWVFVGYSYTGSTNSISIYLDGQSQTRTLPSGAWNTILSSDPSDIGKQSNGYLQYFQGYISNVQIYNTALSANEVTALYDEGIGGDPININYLVGWWPLNGNANDYSGNLNNGVPAGVAYTSSWTSGYAAP